MYSLHFALLLTNMYSYDIQIRSQLFFSFSLLIFMYFMQDTTHHVRLIKQEVAVMLGATVPVAVIPKTIISTVYLDT